jgi:hypothetical protein
LDGQYTCDKKVVGVFIAFFVRPSLVANTILKALLGATNFFETEIRAQEGFFIIDRHNAAQS